MEDRHDEFMPEEAAALSDLACRRAAAVVGVVKHKEFDGLARQTHIVMILWAVWFLICFAWWGWDFWLFALPVIIIYALSSAQQFSPMPRSGTMYLQALVLAGETFVKRNNLKPLARVVAATSAGELPKTVER